MKHHGIPGATGLRKGKFQLPTKATLVPETALAASRPSYRVKEAHAPNPHRRGCGMVVQAPAAQGRRRTIPDVGPA